MEPGRREWVGYKFLFFFSFFFSKNLVNYKIKINKSILKNKNKNNNDLSSSGEVNKKSKVLVIYI